MFTQLNYNTVVHCKGRCLYNIITAGSYIIIAKVETERTS